MLTEQIRDLAETVGVEIAAELVKHFGGTRMYVPANPKPHHGLVKLLAPEHVAALVSTYPGTEIEVPMHLFDEAKARRILVMELRGKGYTQSQIARRAKCTDRQVRHILAADKKSTPTLF